MHADLSNGGVSTSKLAGPPMTANNTRNQAALDEQAWEILGN